MLIMKVYDRLETIRVCTWVEYVILGHVLRVLLDFESSERGRIFFFVVKKMKIELPSKQE